MKEHLMGRSSLLMVMGFGTALMMIGSNISRVSNNAMANYTYYYSSSVAHSIAGSGINLAARSLFENAAWRAGFAKKAFGGGTFTCTLGKPCVQPRADDRNWNVSG